MKNKKQKKRKIKTNQANKKISDFLYRVHFSLRLILA